jgi:hypothetical protein
VKEILLVGVALNYFGALKLLFSALAAVPGSSNLPQEYLQFKLFTAGTAAVFGSLYLYLYFHTVFAIPFLAFGAALKTWAFLLSLYLYLRHRLSRGAFLEFGVSNGLVALLFWYYIASIA